MQACMHACLFISCFMFVLYVYTMVRLCKSDILSDALLVVVSFLIADRFGLLQIKMHCVNVVLC